VVKKFKTVEDISQAKEAIHLVRVIVVETYEDSALRWHRTDLLRADSITHRAVRDHVAGAQKALD
jgi:hypothetical protein